MKKKQLKYTIDEAFTFHWQENAQSYSVTCQPFRTYEPKRSFQKSVTVLEPSDLHVHLVYTSCDHQGKCYSFCSDIATWHDSPAGLWVSVIPALELGAWSCGHGTRIEEKVEKFQHACRILM